MDEKTLFEQRKLQVLQDNEERYGREARRRYGDEAVDAANERLRELTQDAWDDKDRLEDAIKDQLRSVMASGDTDGPSARALACMHERWIRIHWGDAAYTRQAHLGLARMYLADERFRAYYDGAAGAGATEVLVAALESYLGGGSSQNNCM